MSTAEDFWALSALVPTPGSSVSKVLSDNDMPLVDGVVDSRSTQTKQNKLQQKPTELSTSRQEARLSLARSILMRLEEIQHAQEEHKLLLQDVLRQAPKDLTAAKQGAPEATAQKPLTHTEMQAILEPMQKCLQSVQEELQKFPTAKLDNNCSPGSIAPKAYLAGITSDLTPHSTPLVVSTTFNDDEPGQPSSPEHLNDESMEISVLAQRKLKRELEESGDHKPHLEDIIVMRVEEWLRCWSGIQMPEYRNCFFTVVNTSVFQTLCMFAITLNSVLVAATADWQVKHIGQDDPQLLGVLQQGFGIFFMFELALRLMAYRMYFFVSQDMMWNIFDFVLVAISVVDLIIQSVAGSNSGNNVSFMRMLRLLKMARIFRSLRAFQFFKELNIMLTSLKKTFLSLFWGLVLLSFVLYLFALIFLQAVVDYLNMELDGTANTSGQIQRIIDSRFSSLGQTLVALYMSVTGGEEWSSYYDMMLGVGTLYGFLYLFFTFFFIFGLFNILTGLVVEKAMVESEVDRSDAILQRRRQLAESRRELKLICKHIDKDNSGKISFQEFRKWMKKQVIKDMLDSMGLDVKDIYMFFHSVAAEHQTYRGISKGEVAIDRFVEGCLHMRGNATAVDMQKQLYEMDVMLRTFRNFDAAISGRLSRIENTLSGSTIM